MQGRLRATGVRCSPTHATHQQGLPRAGFLPGASCTACGKCQELQIRLWTELTGRSRRRLSCNGENHFPSFFGSPSLQTSCCFYLQGAFVCIISIDLYHPWTRKARLSSTSGWKTEAQKTSMSTKASSPGACRAALCCLLLHTTACCLSLPVPFSLSFSSCFVHQGAMSSV